MSRRKSAKKKTRRAERPTISNPFCPVCKRDTPCEHYNYSAAAKRLRGKR